MSENETEPAAKTAIRRAAFRLLTTRGISDASFTAIAEESGQGRSLVHYYYPKKDALVLEFLGRLIECIAHAQIPEPAEGGAPAHVISNGGIFELLHEKLVDGSCDLTPAELSSMSLGTFLAICQNRPWKETVSDELLS